MNKEKLIQEMDNAIMSSIWIDHVGDIAGVQSAAGICADIALKHMPQWVKVEDELPLPIFSTVGKISKYVPFITLDDKEWFGYYDYIGKVWQAQGFKTFRKDEVKSWFNLPTPPKQ